MNMRKQLAEFRAEMDRQFEVVRGYIHMQLGKPENPRLPSAPETSLDTAKSDLLERLDRIVEEAAQREFSEDGKVPVWVESLADQLVETVYETMTLSGLDVPKDRGATDFKVAEKILRESMVALIKSRFER